MATSTTSNTNQTDPAEKRGVLRKLVLILGPILVVAIFAGLGMLIVKLNKKPEEKKKAFNTLAVMADYAVSDNVTLQVVTQGEARPRTEIDLVPQVGGKIVFVSDNFIEGGIFRKGEVLLRIEAADYEVAKVRAEANVAQAEQLLVREMAEGEIARQDYEELGRGEPTALALRTPQKQQAEAALQAAKAELQAANLQLQRTAVRAPFSGRVKSKLADTGQFVTPGARMGRIFSTDIVEVRLPLTDLNLSKMDLPIAYVAKSQAEAPIVQLSATIGGVLQKWEGRIMRTDPTYDTQTRALFAIAEVFDPYGNGRSDGGVPLAPGLFLDASIEGKSFESVIVIARDGLRPDNEVYVVDDKGKSEIRKASVLDSNAKYAYLLGGVEVGELVILSPMERSRVNIPLKVLDVNDPATILVEPPKPDWLIAKEKAEAARGDDKTKKTRRWGKKSSDDDAEKPEKPLKKSDKKDSETSGEMKKADPSK